MNKKLSPTNKNVKNMEVEKLVKKGHCDCYNNNKRKDVTSNQEEELNND